MEIDGNVLNLFGLKMGIIAKFINFMSEFTSSVSEYKTTLSEF